MEADGTLADEILPEYVFNAYFECEDPLHQELSTKDVTATLDAYTHYMITTYGQPAGDSTLRTWHGKQLKRRLRHLPDHGKGLPGPKRQWKALLYERKRNLGRKDSKVSGNIQTSAHSCPSRAAPAAVCLT